MKMNKVRIMAECAIMIALATGLSYLKPFEAPMGGGVTILSQAPIVVIGYRHGWKWGSFTGVVHGVLQMVLQGLGNFSYVKGLPAYLILIFMDYLLAFGVLGLGGALFRNLKNQPLGIGMGAAAASVMRFVCHFISGVTIWGDYAEGWSGVWAYSAAYNGWYMAIELVITVVGCVALAAALDLKSPDLIRKKTTN